MKDSVSQFWLHARYCWTCETSCWKYCSSSRARCTTFSWWGKQKQMKFANLNQLSIIDTLNGILRYFMYIRRQVMKLSVEIVEEKALGGYQKMRKDLTTQFSLQLRNRRKEGKKHRSSNLEVGASTSWRFEWKSSIRFRRSRARSSWKWGGLTRRRNESWICQYFIVKTGPLMSKVSGEQMMVEVCTPLNGWSFTVFVLNAVRTDVSLVTGWEEKVALRLLEQRVIYHEQSSFLGYFRVFFYSF